MLAYCCRQHGVAHPLIGLSLKRAGRVADTRIERDDLWDVFPSADALAGESALDRTPLLGLTWSW
ncbi:hypothetical protein REMIM1_PF00983 (plasmid) [Rhizobium etli bv. mimosae str. Mim1]|nr:hypothetical protein REMIM1_PF00983 [Rhizobium etli bv. mimosae str. Mim1]